MSVREYVGARYVPKFSDVNGGVWANTYSYEPLTIVKYGTDFYTSKIPVPVGVSISDDTYWVKTGDYNGAIISLQNEIDELNENKSDEMKNRVYLFIADSYDVVGDFVDSVGDWIGCKRYIKRSQDGASFIRHDAPWSNYTYINVLTTLDPISASDLDEITDVVIFPSVNDDANDATEMLTAMQTIDTYCRNHMPNLRRIQLLSIGWASCNYNRQKQIIQNLRYYCDYSIQLGWSYIDCTRVMRMCYWVSSSDGFHPTTAGGVEIAKATANAILTGSCQWSSDWLTYHFGIVFDASLGTPTVVSPSGGDFIIRAQCKPNGNIDWRMQHEISFQGIDFPNYAQYVNKLTHTDYKNPFPAFYRASDTPLRNAMNNSIDMFMLSMSTSNELLFYIVGGNASGTPITWNMRVLQNDHTINAPEPIVI